MSNKEILTVLAIILSFAYTNVQGQKCQAEVKQPQQNEVEKKNRLGQLADMDFEQLMDIAFVSENTSKSSISQNMTIVSEKEIKQSSAKNLLQLLREVSQSKCPGASIQSCNKAFECSRFILNEEPLSKESTRNQKLRELSLQEVSRIEIKEDSDNSSARVIKIYTKEQAINL